jgi:hypothetical protein
LGFIYLAVVLDALSRRVGQLETHLHPEFVLEAPNMALGQRRPTKAVGIARQDDFGLLRNAVAHAAEHQVLLEHQTEHRDRSAVWRHWKCDRRLRSGVDLG